MRDLVQQPVFHLTRSGLPSLFDMAAIITWAVVWYGLWKLASILAVNFGISAWYPPAAISLFLLIRYGLAAAPALFLASLLAGAGQWKPYPGLHEVLGSLAHVTAYLAAALLYQRLAAGDGRSLRPHPLAALIYAALAGSALTAVLGNVNIYLASGGAYELGFERLFAWAVGDFFGVISLCPGLLFVWSHLNWSWSRLRALPAMLRTPLAALALALALASMLAAVASGSDLDYRLLCMVGVGVFSVIVAYVVSPRSAVLYLFCLAVLAAAWLSTEITPSARIEFAVQICIFLIAAHVMIYLKLDNAKERVAAVNRRLRIRDLAEQRDALSRRISVIETEFAKLAHELKTPLGGIIGLLEITEVDVASGDPRAQVARYFKHMRGCALYLNAIVDDTFDVTRLSRGQFEPVLEPFEVAGMLADLELICRAKSSSSVTFPTATDLDGVSVRTDRNRLIQILINLVVNAVRYADRGGAIIVRCTLGPQTVTLAVENPAAGMTKARLDSFIEGGHGVAANSRGLGIGLPLVGRLAAGIGAGLSTSVVDGVVTVSVTVPRV